VRVVAAGDALFAPSIARRLIEEFANLPDPTVAPAVLAQLTDRPLSRPTSVGGHLTDVLLTVAVDARWRSSAARASGARGRGSYN
jgi:hypothetical protein